MNMDNNNPLLSSPVGANQLLNSSPLAGNQLLNSSPIVGNPLLHSPLLTGDHPLLNSPPLATNSMLKSPPPAHTQLVVPSLHTPVVIQPEKSPIPAEQKEIVGDAPLDLSRSSAVEIGNIAEVPLDLSKPKSHKSVSVNHGNIGVGDYGHNLSHHALTGFSHSSANLSNKSINDTAVVSHETAAERRQEIVADDDDDVIVLGVQKARRPVPSARGILPQFTGIEPKIGQTIRPQLPGTVHQNRIAGDHTQYRANKKDSYSGSVAYTPFDLHSGLLRLKQMLMMAKDPQQARQLAHSFQKMALHALLKSRLNQQQRGGFEDVSQKTSPSASVGTPPSGSRVQSPASAGTPPSSVVAPLTTTSPSLTVNSNNGNSTVIGSLGSPPIMLGNSSAALGATANSTVIGSLGSPPIMLGNSSAALGATAKTGGIFSSQVSDSQLKPPSAFVPTHSTSVTSNLSTQQSIQSTTSENGNISTVAGAAAFTTIVSSDSRSPSNSSRSSPAQSAGSPASSGNAASRLSNSSPSGNGNFESEFMKYVRSKRLMTNGIYDVATEKQVSEPIPIPSPVAPPPQATLKVDPQFSELKLPEPVMDKKKKSKPTFRDYQHIIAEINKVTKSALQMAETMYRRRQVLATTPPPAHSKVPFTSVNPKKPHHSMLRAAAAAGNKALSSHMKPEQLADNPQLKESPPAGHSSGNSGLESSKLASTKAAQQLSFTNNESSSLRLQKYIERQHQLYRIELSQSGLSPRTKTWTPPVARSLTAENNFKSSETEAVIQIPKPKIYSELDLNVKQQTIEVGEIKVDQKSAYAPLSISNTPYQKKSSNINYLPVGHSQLQPGVQSEESGAYKRDSNNIEAGPVIRPTVIDNRLINIERSTSRINIDGNSANNQPPGIDKVKPPVSNTSEHYIENASSPDIFKRLNPPFPCVSPNGSTVVKPVTSTFIGWNVSGYKRVPVANVNPIKVKGTEGFMDIAPITSESSELPNQSPFRNQGFFPPHGAYPTIIQPNGRNADQSNNMGVLPHPNSGPLTASQMQQQQQGLFLGQVYSGNGNTNGNKLSGDPSVSNAQVEDDRVIMLSSYGAPGNNTVESDTKSGFQDKCIQGNNTELGVKNITNVAPQLQSGVVNQISSNTDNFKKAGKVRKKRLSKKDDPNAPNVKKTKKDKYPNYFKPVSVPVTSKSVDTKAEAIKAILRDGISKSPLLGSGGVNVGSSVVMVLPDGDDGSSESIRALENGNQVTEGGSLPEVGNEAAEVVRNRTPKPKSVGKGVCFYSDDEVNPASPTAATEAEISVVTTDRTSQQDTAGNITTHPPIGPKKRGRKKRVVNPDDEPPRVKRKYIKKSFQFWSTRTGGKIKVPETYSDAGQLQLQVQTNPLKIKGKRGRKKKLKINTDRLRYSNENLYYNKNAKYEEELIREEERRLVLRAKRQARCSSSNDDFTPHESEASRGGFPGENEADRLGFPVETEAGSASLVDGSVDAASLPMQAIDAPSSLITDSLLDKANIFTRGKFPLRGRKKLSTASISGKTVNKVRLKRGRKRIHPLPVVKEGQIEIDTDNQLYKDYPSEIVGGFHGKRGLKKRRRKRWYKRRKPLPYLPYQTEYYIAEAEDTSGFPIESATYDPIYDAPEAAAALLPLEESIDPDLVDLQVPYVDPALLAEIKTIVVCRETGESKLHRLTRMGHEDLAIRCIEAGVFDVNGRDHAGYSALHESCVTGRLRVAKSLLANGCEVNGAAMDGTRAIHDAVDHYRLELVRLLLSCGADPKTSTYSGKTPLKIARMPDMQRLLTGHLQDINGPQSGEKTQYWEFPLPTENKSCDQQGMDIFTDVPSDLESESEDFEFELWDEEPMKCYHLCIDPDDGPRNYYLLSELSMLKNIPQDDFKILNFDLTYKSLNKSDALALDADFPGGKEAIHEIFKDDNVVDFVESNPLVHSILELDTVSVSQGDVLESRKTLHDVSFTETPIEKVNTSISSSSENSSEIDICISEPGSSSSHLAHKSNLTISSKSVKSGIPTMQSCSRKLRFSRENRDEKVILSKAGGDGQNRNNHNKAVVVPPLVIDCKSSFINVVKGKGSKSGFSCSKSRSYASLEERNTDWRNSDTQVKDVKPEVGDKRDIKGKAGREDIPPSLHL